MRAKSIVPKVGEPDIDESYIRQQDVVVLETLLIDRTGYGCEEQMTIGAIAA